MSYVSLLRRNPLLARLAAIQTLGYFGSWFSHVAIFAILLELKAPPLVIALASVAMFLPAVLLAPFSGPIVDRTVPKRLMTTLLAIETVCTFALIAAAEESLVWLLLLMVFLRMGSASFYFTAEMSLLPKILNSIELKKANELHSIIWSATYTLGMALGGITVQILSAKTAILLDGILLAVATLLLSILPLRLGASSIKESVFSSIAAGISYLRSNPKLLGWMGLHATVGLTAYDALVALLSDRYYASVIAAPLAIGYINALRALALVVGPIFLGFLSNRRNLAVLFVLQGVGIEIWAICCDDFWLSLFGTFLTGLVTTTLWSFTITTLQESIDPAFLGRVLAYNDMLFMIVAVGTSTLIGVLAQIGVDFGVILALLGVGFFIAAAVYSKLSRPH